jgi:hypothetical protein
VRLSGRRCPAATDAKHTPNSTIARYGDDELAKSTRQLDDRNRNRGRKGWRECRMSWMKMGGKTQSSKSAGAKPHRRREILRTSARSACRCHEQPDALPGLDGLHSRLISRLLADLLSEPNARPPTILIDEFDAGRLERVANCQIVRRGHGGVVSRLFSPPNGGQSEPGLSGEIVGAPSNEPPGSSDLSAGQRNGR